MNVLVNGIGNIGTTILNILSKYKEELGINNTNIVVISQYCDYYFQNPCYERIAYKKTPTN